MLPSKATLPLWNEPSYDYVGLPVTEIIYGPVDLWFSAVSLFLDLNRKYHINKLLFIFNFIYASKISGF